MSTVGTKGTKGTRVRVNRDETVHGKRADRLLTYTYRLGNMERRVMTIHIWAPPHEPVGNDTIDIQRWFLHWLRELWWDCRELESFMATTHIAQAMTSILQRERKAYESESV